MITNDETPPKLNLTEGSLNNIRSKLKCCIKTEELTAYTPQEQQFQQNQYKSPLRLLNQMKTRTSTRWYLGQ